MKYLVTLSYPTRMVLDCEVEANDEDAATRAAESFAVEHPERFKPNFIPLTPYDVESETKVERVIPLRRPR